MDFFSQRWSPYETPYLIRTLIFITATIAILSALTNGLFHFLHYSGPQEWFSLSWHGIKQLYLWQLVSYLFILETTEGITLFFLIALFFNMYILWILGSTLMEEISEKHFLLLYFLIGVVSGLAAVLSMPLIKQYTVLTGPSAVLLGLFYIWASCYADSILSLFFLFPVKTKWALAGIVGSILLLTLSSGNFISFIFFMSGLLTAYLYGVIVLHLKSPYSITHSLDKKLMALSQKSDVPKSDSKIVNLKGEPILNDELFIDAMLTKISQHGEQSLTTSERRRMQQISERKSRK